MAPKLDISLSKLKKGGKGGGSGLPEKRYIDLMVSDASDKGLAGSLPKILLAVVAAAAFAKFGVLDLYAQVNEKQAAVDARQSDMEVLRASLADYDKIQDEYNGYQVASTDENGLVVDANDVLELINTRVVPNARIASFSMSGDTLTLQLTGMQLDSVGQLSRILGEQELVEDVSVQTASSRTLEGLVTTMTVTLASSDTLQEENGEGEQQ